MIGRKCKHLTRDNALSAVLGFTIGNDVSERTWQKSDRTLWRAKNTDTFKPMGPWIETNVKLDDLVTKVRLNGKELIAFQTNHMVFGVVDFLVAMTQVSDAVSRRRAVDGHRGRHREHEARRCLRDRDQRHRHIAQSGCAGDTDMDTQREVVVVSGVRTAIGDFGGGLKDVAPTELGAQVVREALCARRVSPATKWARWCSAT